jgi:hypothetical protein
MLGIHTRARIDLQSVVVACVLKETVHGIQNLVRQQEEKLSASEQHRQHRVFDDITKLIVVTAANISSHLETPP